MACEILFTILFCSSEYKFIVVGIFSWNVMATLFNHHIKLHYDEMLCFCVELLCMEEDGRHAYFYKLFMLPTLRREHNVFSISILS